MLSLSRGRVPCVLGLSCRTRETRLVLECFCSFQEAWPRIGAVPKNSPFVTNRIVWSAGKVSGVDWIDPSAYKQGHSLGSSKDRNSTNPSVPR